MQKPEPFLSSILSVLRAFEGSNYSALDAKDIPVRGEQEREIVNALIGIQRRNLRIQDVLRQCVRGDYSLRATELDEHDVTGKLISVVLANLREVVRQANTISLGDYSEELLPQSEKDELGLALYRMTKTLREIAEVSTAISSGDFTRQVETKGQRDFLAQRINEMIGSLHEIERQTTAIASGDYDLEIGPRGERDELARSIDKMMRIIRTQLIALRQSNQSLTEFAHVASHDLNAPLCKIKYSCDLLRDACHGKLPEKLFQLFSVIERGCDQLLKLIADLLEHARIGGNEVESTRIDLNDLVKSIIPNFSHIVEKSGARISVEPLPIVLGTRTSLLRLFQNLISNALKYRSDNPLLLVIRATEEAKQWVVSFTDNGIGLNSADRHRIFDPFVRLHARSDIPGTGIGLATCKKVADQLGGKIWVESEVGVGSTFFVSFPKTLSDGESVQPLSKKKILLIDDDKDQLLIFSALLEKGNFEIVTSGSSREALTLLEKEAFDLAVSDVQMPQMSGAQFLQAARKFSKIPILMLTSSGPERHAELVALGADDFCAKKDAFTLLVPKVLTLLRI